MWYRCPISVPRPAILEKTHEFCTIPFMSRKNQVGVYGLGRFGLFWATRLAEKGFDVVGCSRRAADPPPGVRQVSVEEVLDSPTIFYCVSISSFEEVLATSLPYLKEGAVVMDTCSVKLYPARVMKRLLPPTIQAIATHPMFGPDSGRDGLEGLPFVMDNISAREETFRWWIDEFTSWKMDVLMMSCDQHDREAAWSQGITHFIGRTLAELNLGSTRLATKGYQTLMGVVEQTCNDPLQLFYDLQRYNPYTKQMRMGLRGALVTTMEALKEQEDIL